MEGHSFLKGRERVREIEKERKGGREGEREIIMWSWFNCCVREVTYDEMITSVSTNIIVAVGIIWKFGTD